MTHVELIAIGCTWLKRPWRNATGEGHGACSVVLSELVTYARETPDVIGWSNSHSIVIECKTSRADFFADRKKFTRRNPSEGVGEQRFFLTPTGLIAVDEWPEGWGLLETCGKAVIVKRTSRQFKSNERAEIIMLLSVIRRANSNAEKLITAKDTIEKVVELRNSLFSEMPFYIDSGTAKDGRRIGGTKMQIMIREKLDAILNDEKGGK